MRLLALAVAAFLPLTALPLTAIAQERANTILVLDGSGSMWGQIDGVNKIVIARDVVGELLDGFPDNQNLGLTVYGHRERGNCADIETVVAPGAGTLGEIRDAVNAINPRGKTPMTDAVIAAAEALRYTEEKATVILVSDGIETCNPDPCAAAAALEDAGIDFTAHVVGFDVTDPAALAQMQCIADGTGGQFLSAANAAELTNALTTVAVAEPEPEPEPVMTQVTFEARLDTEDGPLVDGPVLWTLSPLPENVTAEEEGNGLIFDMAQGSYDVTAYWLAGEAEASRQFIASADPRTIVMVFDSPALTATVTGPATAVAGSTIEVSWNGPNAEYDYIGIGLAGADGAAQWENYTNTADGTVLDLLVPMAEGDYVIGYFLSDGREMIGQTPITVTPVTATLTGPQTAVAGSVIEVAWTGPDYQNDYIGIGKADAEGGRQWENYVYTSDGSPLDLLVPTQPGDYLIRYFADQDRTELTSVSLTVTEVTATVTAPQTATAGSTIEVAWTGPDNQDDYIGIGRADADGGAQWENYTYTREGAPLDLLVPTDPGDYLIRYFLSQDRTPIAEAALTVTEVLASVTAPATATAGSTIEVGWTGPDNQDDYIGIGRTDADGGAQWENYTYTREGAQLDLLMPTDPGDYIIQYFLSQDRTPIAETLITIEEVSVSVSGPAEALGGDTISITWSGPDYKDDYIGIGRTGEDGGRQWEQYTYTREGNPVDIEVPLTPGDYLVQYFLAQDRTAIATMPLTVSAVTATVTGPASAAAGSTIEIGWTGPDYKDDYIGIGGVGETGGSQWKSYVYTREGATQQIVVPPTPGDYLITYFAAQGRTALASVPLTITPVDASLTAPAEAEAGSDIEVGWTGPNYNRDYVGIGRVGETGGKRWESYFYTEDGAPGTLSLPETPGDYVIQYFMALDRTPVASVPITLK